MKTLLAGPRSRGESRWDPSIGQRLEQERRRLAHDRSAIDLSSDDTQKIGRRGHPACSVLLPRLI
jgi:hypothetical protein